MSYEGYEEYLCETGHYWTRDVYSKTDDGEKCPYCNGKPSHWHPVDQTNGFELNNFSTYPAVKHTSGYKDVWQKDHYGNQYATKITIFKPGKQWKEYKG